ncbi:MAG: hypothetical protein PGN07_03440 [Aeromicrobium erythreum]
MSDDTPLQVGATARPVQLSPCVGGVVRTWTDDGTTGVWSSPQATWLADVQGTGWIGRTQREERRYREAALLSDDGALVVRGRYPLAGQGGTTSMEASVLALEPARAPTGDVMADLRALLARAVRHCVASGEFLVVERGGWDAPQEPFCLFALVEGPREGRVSVVETAPDPTESPIWAPHVVPGRPSQTLSAPASDRTVDVVPVLVLEAITRWGLQPWDLALTFGQR